MRLPRDQIVLALLARQSFISKIFASAFEGGVAEVGSF